MEEEIERCFGHDLIKKKHGYYRLFDVRNKGKIEYAFLVSNDNNLRGMPAINGFFKYENIEKNRYVLPDICTFRDNFSPIGDYLLKTRCFDDETMPINLIVTSNHHMRFDEGETEIYSQDYLHNLQKDCQILKSRNQLNLILPRDMGLFKITQTFSEKNVLKDLQSPCQITENNYYMVAPNDFNPMEYNSDTVKYQASQTDKCSLNRVDIEVEKDKFYEYGMVYEK